MKSNIAIFTTCALVLAQAEVALAGYSSYPMTETTPMIAVQNVAEPSIKVAQNATVNQSGAILATKTKPNTSPDILKLTNGTGGGRFTFKPTIGQKPADGSVKSETSNRDHIDQDAQGDLKK